MLRLWQRSRHSRNPDLADAYGIDYETTLELLQMGPLKPVVLRALDESNPRPLKRLGC